MSGGPPPEASNNWKVATQGNPTWICHIKHKWQYLEENKLRACERCGQMQGRRNYLAWIADGVDWPTLSRAGKQLQKSHEKNEYLQMFNDRQTAAIQSSNTLRLPPPKRRPWEEHLPMAPPPPEPPTMKELRNGVELNTFSALANATVFKKYKAHGAGPGCT